MWKKILQLQFVGLIILWCGCSYWAYSLIILFNNACSEITREFWLLLWQCPSEHVSVVKKDICHCKIVEPSIFRAKHKYSPLYTQGPLVLLKTHTFQNNNLLDSGRKPSCLFCRTLFSALYVIWEEVERRIFTLNF